jgi:hypothetical protein
MVLTIPFLFRKKETYMDAWLFNAGMIQLASVGVSYFLSLSFTVYARLSANNGKSIMNFPKKAMLTILTPSHLQLVCVQYARLEIRLVALVLGADWSNFLLIHLFCAKTCRIQKEIATHAIETIEKQIRNATSEQQ